jgi:uncharacterized OsmC-like protein
MKISARLRNSAGNHQVSLQTGEKAHSIQIPPKSSGGGSSVNGGELLCLALATCYCNDIYREAAKRNIRVDKIEVEVEGDFGAEGEPARSFAYHVKVTAHASEEEIGDLIQYTDHVAEIQNTLRAAVPVSLDRVEVIQS